MTHKLILLLLMVGIVRGWTCDALVNEREDCGWSGISQLECAYRECCWEPSDRTPWCFKPIQRCWYSAQRLKKTESDEEYLLEKRCKMNYYDVNAISMLKMTINYLRFGVVNVNIQPIDTNASNILQNAYPKLKREKRRRVKVVTEEEPFAFQIWRKSDGQLLFDMQELVFQEYYLSIETSLAANSTLHGLGYRAGPLKLEFGMYALFSRDASTLESNGNLYSAHPMYMNILDGRVHGVFHVNTFPSEAEYKKQRLLMRHLGGTVNMFVFPGPTIEKVYKQYLSIIGTPPPLDPRFLGLQQSRYGYKNLEQIRTMVRQYRENKLPLDVVWMDIEYQYCITF